MADVGSLEKMGRELKCPICLSLLSSAVSITCNHIFCNGCLTESMKSASSCPVCKVPYRRREIRPAPHMDNLVAVFKSMEAAAGTSVMSTQVAPAPKVAECGNSGCKTKRLQKKVASKKEKNTTKATAASASCPTTKPSFPTSKRIHVTPFPESETPMKPKKIMKPEEPKNKLNGDVGEDKDKTLTSDKPGSPSLSPFFWLREGGEEGGTAETLSEPLSLDTPLRHNAPAFSDIKDSDNEIPNNTTPNSKAKVTEVFDSEIFEWSQRPCSPELCSTPLKKQGKFKNILDQITEKDDGGDMHHGGSFDKLDHANNAAQPQPVNAEDIKQKRKKARARNINNSKLPNHGKLCTKGSDVDQQGTNIPISIAAKPHQKNSSTKERNPWSGRNKVSRNSKRILCAIDKSIEAFGPQENGLEVEAPENQLSERSLKKDKNTRQKKSGRKLEIAGESTVKAAENKPEQRSKRIKRMSDDAVAEKIRVLSETENETEMLQLHNLIKGCTQHKPLDGRSKQTMESNISRNTQNILLGRCQSKTAIHTVPSIENVSFKNGGAKGIEQSDYSGSIRLCTAHNAVLKKCEDKVSKVSCAFCQSDDITEESGEMVHYHNGKQVPAEFNGGANVIHSHKNCLEWAPDVYFEDETVFNLTTELARSRRIKCACCGIKGAALGCFEMSCRKSFHFTCAKLIPQCRWDNENFVVLCPLHQSSKLPIETSELKKESKRKLTPKGSFQVRPRQDYGNKWTWPSGSPQKWILCCSALSAAEKGTVSEFAKIAGVSISTSWSPTVTHVIASTDQSGACKRTLKFLMAILNGKWIVSIDWVKTCMECMEPVDEQRFEVTVDVHGTSEGPMLGRQRVIHKEPKLFDGIQFYLHGDYTKSYRGYLQDLVVAAGGTVLQRKPVSRDQQKLLDDSSLILILYSVENQDMAKSKSKDGINTGRSQADAQALACASGGKVVSSAWIIDSIAACSLQPL
ncbi:protein BREAST CANCER SUSCEPTIBILITY 1 homolog isoform X2 [Phragmites australis]|uniref:protein BREAST CANCER SUSCEPTIBILITY 1 homolog isoform X2 n=1 Tax=Phragmites australis TaxID=29695 RepID=UPI002D77C580|nr:protein BREAST CANCER SUSCEPTIBILITY 1 homolog isoform X2 [Phragmites australis]